MARRSSLRASDADRDQVTELLRQAAAEGRILAHELEDRLATALRATTYGDLDAVTADLPGNRVERSSRKWQLAEDHPVATVTVLVAATLLVCMLAMIVLAGLFAFSGVWVILAFIFMARRGGPGGWGPRGGHRRTRGGNYRRNIASRW